MDNIFIFGMKENEVEDLKKRGYNAFDYYNANAELKQVRLKILFFLLRKNAKRNELFFFNQVIDQIASGFFSPNNPDEFRDIYNNLMYHDRFFCLADFDDYIAAQERVNEAYKVSIDQLNYASHFAYIFMFHLLKIEPERMDEDEHSQYRFIW